MVFQKGRVLAQDGGHADERFSYGVSSAFFAEGKRTIPIWLGHPIQAGNGRHIRIEMFGVNVRVEPVGVLPLHLSELAVLVKLRGLFPTC